MGRCMSCRTCRASLSAPRRMTTGRESQDVLGCCVVSPVEARRAAASPEGSQDGLSSWGILPMLMKSHLSFRGWRQTKKPNPSQPQKWAWPFLSLFIFYMSFCSSVPVLSILHIFILHLPFSHYLQTHWRHCGGNEQRGVHSLWLSLMLRLRCHGHEQPEKNPKI